MKVDDIESKVNEAGHKADDWVDDTAAKHNYPKWKVWLGIGIAVLAVIGAAHVLGAI